MNTRRNRALRIVLAALVVFGILVAVAGVSIAVAVVQESHRYERRLVHLLSETDYEALLRACREFSRRTANGELKRTSYVLHPGLPLPWFVRYHPNPEVASLPPEILDAAPLTIVADERGRVWLASRLVPRLGVVAYPEDYPDYNDHMGAVELVPGLWYYDETYGPNHPEWLQYINELLEKGKEFQEGKRGQVL